MLWKCLGKLNELGRNNKVTLRKPAFWLKKGPRLLLQN